MSLKEQILLELKKKNSLALEEMKKCDEAIAFEKFKMSTINEGALAGTARKFCQSNIDSATRRKENIKNENAWVSEMLSKY